MPATRVILPETVIAAVPVNVPVNPVQLIDWAPKFPDAIVTVFAPDAALRKTGSTTPGTVAPPAPPELVAHFDPAVPSQESVPPTQYLPVLAVIFHPVLLPEFTLSVAFHVAPPVATESLITQRVTFTVPDDFDRVNVFPVLSLCKKVE
jgi:hypothetical protein